MLSSIDWLTYWKIIGTSLFVWYVGIILLFYRKFIAKIFYGSKVNNTTNEKIVEIQHNELVVPEFHQTDILKTVQQIIAQIKEAFDSFTVDTPTDELITSLQKIVEPHVQLKYSEFQSALSEYIQSNVTKIGRDPLTAEELSAVWNSPQK